MTDTTLEQVKGALIDLNEAMKTPDTHRLVQSMEALDGLVARLGDQLDPRLRHFLERRSYAKALAHVHGAIPSAPPSGGCTSERK